MRLDNAYYIYPSEYEYRSSEKCSRDEEMSPFEIDKFHKFQRVVTRNDRRLSTRIDQFSSLEYFFQRSIRATVRWKTYRVEFGSLLDRTSLRHRRFTRCHDDVGNALQYRVQIFVLDRVESSGKRFNRAYCLRSHNWKNTSNRKCDDTIYFFINCLS